MKYTITYSLGVSEIVACSKIFLFYTTTHKSLVSQLIRCSWDGSHPNPSTSQHLACLHQLRFLPPSLTILVLHGQVKCRSVLPGLNNKISYHVQDPQFSPPREHSTIRFVNSTKFSNIQFEITATVHLNVLERGLHGALVLSNNKFFNW